MDPLPRRLKIAVLISGGGTTLRNLIEKKEAGRLDVDIRLVVSSSPTAGGLRFAREASIPSLVVRREDYSDVASFSRDIFQACRQAEADLVVMGGFLKLIAVPDDFQGRVINIHPGLIPSFCGKGFYGHHVHEAVLRQGCKISGCTIHFVDNHYDHGPIIIQRVVPVYHTDTPDELAARVFREECEAYPEAIRLYAAGRLKIDGQIVQVL